MEHLEGQGVLVLCTVYVRKDTGRDAHVRHYFVPGIYSTA